MPTEGDTTAHTGTQGRQHLVDPEVCSACLSCIAVCPQSAIVDKGRRVAIDPDLCKDCRTCVDECTTGAIETWVSVSDAPYSLEEQFEWDRLPPLPRL